MSKQIFLYAIGSFLIIFAISTTVLAGEEQQTVKLMQDLMGLNDNIVDVRPSRMKQFVEGKAVIQWMPTIVLKKKMDFSEQINLANKVAAYMYKFQKKSGVKAVDGGIMAFFNGMKWIPKIGNLSYKLIGSKWPKIEVWVNYQKELKKGRAKCCDGGKKIGVVKKGVFESM
ncbi:hypothetical protein BVY03_04845 [bacterium K02(2017)]|nr:hypothetical protein BVY03_04845 [bacterium K02(2017)]